MRQVPKYLIIGNGRVAKHFCHYFDYLDLTYNTWARSTNNSIPLVELLAQATHVLVLINDPAIDEFIETHIKTLSKNLTLIHCSGSLISKHAYSAHPLQSFTDSLYSLDDYKKIPFILATNAPDFFEILPGLSNPHFKINTKDKAFYHALCVMANNFSTILWQKFFDEMQDKFHIPKEVLFPFLQQTFINIQNNPDQLTGPIARKDKITLEKNLTALDHDKFFKIFQAFVNTFLPEI